MTARILILALALFALGGCATTRRPPPERVGHVEPPLMNATSAGNVALR